MARRQRRAGNGVSRARHCTVMLVEPCDVLAFAGFFFVAFFFGGGLAGGRRFRRAVDLLQPPVGEVIDARPRPAEVSEHDGALALGAGADVDAAGHAGARYRLAFGHAEGDAAEHWRCGRIGRGGTRRCRRSGGGRIRRRRFVGRCRRRCAGAAGAAGCGACATGLAQRPSAPTRSSGPTGPPKFMESLMVAGFDQSGLLRKSIGLEKKPPSFLSNMLVEQPASASAKAAKIAMRPLGRGKRKVPRVIYRLVKQGFCVITMARSKTGPDLLYIGQWPIGQWPRLGGRIRPFSPSGHCRPAANRSPRSPWPWLRSSARARRRPPPRPRRRTPARCAR